MYCKYCILRKKATKEGGYTEVRGQAPEASSGQGKKSFGCDSGLEWRQDFEIVEREVLHRVDNLIVVSSHADIGGLNGILSALSGHVVGEKTPGALCGRRVALGSSQGPHKKTQ